MGDRENEEEKVEALKTVELVDGEPSKNMKIGTSLSIQMKRKLVQFLKSNLDVFTWSHGDMSGIATEVIQHHLNVDPKRKHVQQWWQVFIPERNKAIMEKVSKLLSAGFIREVYYPDWLANVVLGKKANRK